MDEVPIASPLHVNIFWCWFAVNGAVSVLTLQRNPAMASVWFAMVTDWLRMEFPGMLLQQL